MKTVKCKECQKDVPVSGKNGLSNHLLNEHNIEPNKDYYDKVYGKKVCKCCGGEVRFKNIISGYNDFCSAKCININRSENGSYGNKYLDIVKNKIAPEYLEGKTKSYLSDKYSIKVETINSYFKKLKIKTRSKSESAKTANRKLFKPTKNMIADYKHLKPASYMETKYKMSMHSIRSAMKRSGIARCDIEVNKARSANSKAHTKKILFDWEALYTAHINGKPICELSIETGISESVIGRRFKDSNWKVIHQKESVSENKLAESIETLGIDIVRGDRKILGGKEIDIYIPSKKIAIEYNGAYWHSSKSGKSKKYHTEKTFSCLNKGIELIHVWGNVDKEKVFNRLKSKLIGNDHAIGARECTLTDSGDFKCFFDDNHMDGNTGFNFAYGLVYKEELICAISMRKNKEGIEIARFATKQNLTVHHGFSRLMKYVIKKSIELGYDNIITYADIDWTPDYSNSVYFKYGMEYVGKTCERLYYCKGSDVVGRQVFQKKKLRILFPDVYDDNLTANEILCKKGIYPIYKTGNHKFKFTI